jgi:hypothetical protein
MWHQDLEMIIKICLKINILASLCKYAYSFATVMLYINILGSMLLFYMSDWILLSDK